MGDGSHSPSLLAILIAIALLGLAIVVAWVVPLSTATFSPSNGFVALAGFYIAAQVVERGLEFVQPLLAVFWPKGPTLEPGATTVPTLRGNRLRFPLGEGAAGPALNSREVDLNLANRTLVSHGLAVFATAPISALFGLYFLGSTGFKGLDHHWDTVLTAILISGGTKPLHDFISYIEKASTK